MAIGERQVLFACLAVDREQFVHERNGAFQPGVARLSFGLYLDGVDKSAPGMGQAAGVDQVFSTNVFFINDVSVRVEDSAIVLEELRGDRFRSRHFEIEDHAFARCAVLPEEGAMVGALLIRCLHTHMCLVGLDVTAAKQIALHCADYGNQQFAHPQHGIVDRGQRQALGQSQLPA